MQGIPGLSMRMYEWLYRLLDKELRALDDPLDKAPTLRDAIKLVGGDLVLEGNSAPERVARVHARQHGRSPPAVPVRVVDGYSIHVYWDPSDGLMGFPQKLEKRIESLPKILQDLGIDRPLYVTEYGVKMQGARGRSPAGAAAASDRVLADVGVPARLVQRPGAAMRVRGLRQVGPLPHRRPGATSASGG